MQRLALTPTFPTWGDWRPATGLTIGPPSRYRTPILIAPTALTQWAHAGARRRPVRSLHRIESSSVGRTQDVVRPASVPCNCPSGPPGTESRPSHRRLAIPAI